MKFIFFLQKDNIRKYLALRDVLSENSIKFFKDYNL